MQSSLSSTRKKAFLPKISVSADTLLTIISTLFVVLFAYTGLSKLFTIDFFQGAMFRSQLLRPYIIPISYIVPIAELLLALLLALPFLQVNKRTTIKTRRIGLYASTGLMFIFTAYVGYTLVKYANDLPCSCGGIIGSMNWKQHLVFNILFLSLGILSIYLMRRTKMKQIH